MKNHHPITLSIPPVLLLALALLSACGGGEGAGDVTIDAPALSGALKFLGVCSVLCSLIWAASLVFGSRQYERHRNGRRRP